MREPFAQGGNWEVAGGGNETSQKQGEWGHPQKRTDLLRAFQAVKLSLKNKFLLAGDFLCCMLELPAHWAVRTCMT